MYKYIPQKKRTLFRIKLGCIFYTLKRKFFLLKYHSSFANIPNEYFNKKEINLNKIKKDFPYLVFSHSTPIFRNLSKEDSNLQNGKYHNLLLAHKKINGTVIKPGKFFSYWKLIGNPTILRGYKKGMILQNGKPHSGIGGGLCALSNLIYWMTLHSPLSIIERWRHSYDVFPDSNRVLPFGSGATCVYNYRDLLIKNETNNEFIFLISIENNRLCGQILAKNQINEEYEVYQKDHWITQEGQGIYVRHNTIFRKKFLKNDKNHIALEDVLITENHAIMMYNPLITN